MSKITPVKDFSNDFIKNINSNLSSYQGSGASEGDIPEISIERVSETEINVENDIPTPGTVAYFRYMENNGWPSDDIYNVVLSNLQSSIEGGADTTIGAYSVLTSDDYDNFLSLLNQNSSGLIPDEYDFLYIKSIFNKFKYGVDNFFIYYSLIDQQYGDNLSFDEKIKLAYELESADQENNYTIAHSVPVIESGTIKYDDLYAWPNEKTKKDDWYSYKYTGDYLHFFNEYGTKVTTPLTQFKVTETGGVGEFKLENSDIDSNGYVYNPYEDYINIVSNYYNLLMNETLKYPDNYRKKSIESLNTINFIDVENSGYGGVTYGRTINFNLDIDKADQMIDTFHHELGHEYVYNSTWFNSHDWEKVYDIVNAEDVKEFEGDTTLLSDYAHSNSGECFAEAVTEYYNYNQTGELYHNPNDLKMIEINYKGYETLYDYIEALVGVPNSVE